MGKFLKYLVILLVIVFAVGFFAWNILPNFVASKLSDKTGVAVSIEHINFTFTSVTIDDFEVGNPQGSLGSRIRFEKKQTRKLDNYHEELKFFSSGWFERKER